MAHAALVYLMQLLDGELIQFSCRVLEIEEEKASLFHIQANKVLLKSSKFKVLKDVPIFHLMQLKEVLKPLVLPNNDDLMDAAGSPDAQLDSRRILITLCDIQNQIHHMGGCLRAVLHKLNGEVIYHPAPTLTLQRELADDLLAANEDFRKIMAFFCRLVSDAESHYYRAGILLKKLKGCNHDDVNHVKSAAEEAAESIEDFLTVAGRHGLRRRILWKIRAFEICRNVLSNCWETLRRGYDQEVRGAPRFNAPVKIKAPKKKKKDEEKKPADLQLGSSRPSSHGKDEKPKKEKKEEEEKVADFHQEISRSSRHGKDGSPNKEKKEEV